MKIYIFLFLVLITTVCRAKHNVKIYYEQVKDGYNIYADNQEFCPVSIKIDFTITNLDIRGGNNGIYTIAPLKKKQLLTQLTIAKKGKAYKFSYRYLTNYGNDTQENYDNDYVYNLPFSNSSSFKIYQGYNGSFSHQNQNSLDFTMPVGTEITAIRDGVVIDIVEQNDKNCGSESCKKYNNYIIIYHSDGTFAEYTHIKQKGAIVNVGDKVNKGDLIAYSGNVGWSTGPHLHLVIFLQRLNERETLKTQFKIGDGSKAEYLVEKNEYLRDY